MFFDARNVFGIPCILPQGRYVLHDVHIWIGDLIHRSLDGLGVPQLVPVQVHTVQCLVRFPLLPRIAGAKISNKSKFKQVKVILN